MISTEAWTTIRYLKAQELGTRKIAKEVGVARNTVRQAIRSEGPPRYERPPPPNPKPEPLKELVVDKSYNFGEGGGAGDGGGLLVRRIAFNV